MKKPTTTATVITIKAGKKKKGKNGVTTVIRSRNGKITMSLDNFTGQVIGQQNIKGTVINNY
jgi:hypothetical protein